MKSILIKLLVLAVCAAMLLSLFACNDTEDPTEAPTDEKTEAPTDEKTEAPTQKETEAPTQKETEAPTQKETEAPTQGSEAPTTDESESGEAPSESTPGESTPAESTPAESTPGETEPKPEESKPAETEPKPEESKPAETEPKPEEKPTEPEKPTCDGNHPYKDRGEQGHYQDACEICGIERVLEAHTYDIKDGKPTCSVCNYVAPCQGDHAWETDETGHWTNKCLTCGAEGIEKAGHTGATVEGKYICTVCKIELPCPETHKVHSDAEGHWTAACDVCGAAAVEKTAHDDYEEIAADGAFTYECPTCEYAAYTKTIPEGVEVFYSAYNMSTPVAEATNDKLTPNTHVNMSSKAFKFEDGTPYFTFTGNGNTAQLIWMRDTGSASAHEKYCVDMGQAKYMVIKARGTENAIDNVRVVFNTAGSTANVKRFKLPLNAAGAGEWGVYVIDMSTVLSDNYKKSDTDTYKLDCFYIHTNTALPTTDTIDISYVAFVEGDWSNVDALVDEGTVINVSASDGTYDVCYTADGPVPGAGTDGPEQPTDAPEQPSEEPEQPSEEPEQPSEEPEQPSEEPEQPSEEPEQPSEEPEQPTDAPEVPTDSPCAGAHTSYEESVDGNIYTYKCTTCGNVLKTITLTDGVEVFYSAYNMSKPEASATPDKLTPNTHANMDNKAFKFEEGIPYFTFTGQDKAFQLIWMRDTGSASTHEKYQVDMGQAKYMVIKARGTENAINNVRVYFNTAGSTADVAKFKLPLNAAGAEEWGVYVIDMSTVLSANYAKSDDTYKLDCFYICSNTNLATTDRIDIGYVAFVDELTDIDSIVDEETVYNVTSTGGAFSEAK